jgi:hypothetical protein
MERANAKIAGLVPPDAAHNFWHAAKAELGPAVGAVLGAGAANVYGVNPLAGAAAGYGVGAIPEIISSVKETLHKRHGVKPGLAQVANDTVSLRKAAEAFV